ncbi:MAG: hypothetical protein KF777_05020 [Planctomycetaceae bacterium]|nr:hypothetical protein [Planctomycetaceae bacterium]
MNEPQDSASQEQKSADQIDWSDAAFLAVVTGAISVCLLVFGPRSDEPQWLWLGHVVLVLLFCLYLARTAWIGWIKKRRGQGSAHDIPARRGGILETILYLIVVSILWNLTCLATAGACDVLRFDVAKNSSAVSTINALVTGFGAVYLIDFVRKKWTGKRS